MPVYSNTPPHLRVPSRKMTLDANLYSVQWLPADIKLIEKIEKHMNY